MTTPRQKRTLTQIDPRTWEHPADRAALNALRKVPVFDQVLRTVFGFFGEKPLRLAFLSGSVRVSETQFPRVHRLYVEACRTLDVQPYPLYVQQAQVLNAFAFGMQKPFIVLNNFTVQELDDDELSFVLGHEIGHVMSGHTLYLTMMVVLYQLQLLPTTVQAGVCADSKACIPGSSAAFIPRRRVMPNAHTFACASGRSRTDVQTSSSDCCEAISATANAVHPPIMIAKLA